jgi:hypothetical protein
MIQFKENRSAVAIVGLLIATISIVVGGLLAFTDMLIFHFDQRFMKTVYSLWLIGSTLGMTLFLLSTNLRPGK